MTKIVLSGFLGMLLVAFVSARTWTDKKGRKIEAEYLSQTKDTVLLKLKNGKEVSVPFSNLSRRGPHQCLSVQEVQPHYQVSPNHHTGYEFFPRLKSHKGPSAQTEQIHEHLGLAAAKL